MKNKKIILCQPDKTQICVLNGVKFEDVSLQEQPIKDYDTLTFTVDKYTYNDTLEELVVSNGYDYLHAYMKVFIEGVGYFEIQEPKVSNDGIKESKSITAYSTAKEFETKDLVGFKINTGAKDSLEYLANGNVDEMGFAKEYVQFCNESNHELSLMHLVLDKMSGWTVGYVDPLLADKKFSFEANNVNIFGFLTSTVSSTAKCWFKFDTINNTVNAYSFENIGKETGVHITYKNLIKSVEVGIDDNSIFTRINVSGGEDLSISDVNFGDSRIFNLDYFCKYPYMNEDLIQKVNKWVKFREENRSRYVDFSRQINEIENQVYTIDYKVPNDYTDTNQWDGMEETLLKKNLEYYKTLITNLRLSVDSLPEYDEENNYIPWKVFGDESKIDDDKYLRLLYEKGNGYGGYYTYLEVLNYVIPNINIAIENLNKPKDDKTDYLEGYKTNWELYGIIELENKKKSYQNIIETKGLDGYAKPWNELSDEERLNRDQVSYNSLHDEYVKCVGYIGDENTENTIENKLKELRQKRDELTTQENSVIANRKSLVTEASIDNATYGFTDEDKILINILFKDTDYTNNNILSTSLDDTVTILDREEELYQDSVLKLSELSQPQYNFTVAIDDISSIEEFLPILEQHQIDIGNFIWLETEVGHSVKLRIIKKKYNPCTIDDTMTLEFSSMVTSNNGRSDFTNLFGENTRAAKNSIQVGDGNAKDSLEYATNLLSILQKTQMLSNTVSGSGQMLDAETLKKIVADFLESREIRIGNIVGGEAEFKKFFANNIQVDDLASISATIGGLQIAQGSLHTIGKDTVGDPDMGLFLGSDGNFSVGDSNKYIKYTTKLDGGSDLEIKADNFIFINSDGSTSSIKEKMEEMITNQVMEYCYSDSSEHLLNRTEWTEETLPRVEGRYIWQRTLVYKNGDTENPTYLPSSDGICISGKDGKDGASYITVNVSCDTGTYFKNGNIQGTLSATVYKGNQDITSSVKRFVWKRVFYDNKVDDTWSKTTTGNTLLLFNYDVKGSTKFVCEAFEE